MYLYKLQNVSIRFWQWLDDPPPDQNSFRLQIFKHKKKWDSNPNLDQAKGFFWADFFWRKLRRQYAIRLSEAQSVQSDRDINV